MNIIGQALRHIGLKVHVWRSTHPSGCNQKCIHCGEERSEYMMWWDGPNVTWWETTASGDGSCKHGSKELPTRVY